MGLAKGKKRIAVALPDVVYVVFQKACKEKGCSMDYAARLLIQGYLIHWGYLKDGKGNSTRIDDTVAD
jgi:hypothetical protein